MGPKHRQDGPKMEKFYATQYTTNVETFQSQWQNELCKTHLTLQHKTFKNLANTSTQEQDGNNIPILIFLQGNKKSTIFVGLVIHAIPHTQELLP